MTTDDADVLVMLVLHFKHELVFGVQMFAGATATWSSKEKGECISITSIKIIFNEDCVNLFCYLHNAHAWSLVSELTKHFMFEMKS